ncbi:hypothetical protein A2866_02540 [Candidatus Roizmanbacteria bacterium RIFCSPHIGHO2_01_FULL_39_8]|uniref:DinB-like domain-containing protein n=1 Tax=Candidatus Roizmanbacteria bacterium RIFCSPHIGHO2_01_FULL_39_8 TaxID=1802033 RepID=A0A1F7GJA8_9BACT|nr:MAG: hypothetical protein A2866_02540 [Candidatus Roizmanbacteria bacterium RIFCSPHIGHO2_01_FULL_39_8]
MSSESGKWLEKYNPEALPQEIRYRFMRLLKIAAVSEEGLSSLTDEQLNEPLFSSSDTLIKQFQHIIIHTSAFTKLISQATDEIPSRLKTWNYVEQFPELAKVNQMEKAELQSQYGQVLGNLHSILQAPNILGRKVQKPYSPVISVFDVVCDISEHFYLHAQNMIDYYEKFNLPRSISMKAALG